jgi:hypothetical protein
LSDADAFFATSGARVVKTNALDETAITAGTFVSDNDVEKRTRLSAAARKSNDDHNSSFRRAAKLGD